MLFLWSNTAHWLRTTLSLSQSHRAESRSFNVWCYRETCGLDWREVGGLQENSGISILSLNSTSALISVYYYWDLIFTGLVTIWINNNTVPAPQVRAQILGCGCFTKKDSNRARKMSSSDNPANLKQSPRLAKPIPVLNFYSNCFKHPSVYLTAVAWGIMFSGCSTWGISFKFATTVLLDKVTVTSCPSHSCEHYISGMFWENFSKCDTNIHLVSRINRIDFGGGRRSY